MIAVRAPTIWGATLIPSWGRILSGAACGGDEPRRVTGKFAHVGQFWDERRGRRHARDARAGALVFCGVDAWPPSDLMIPNKNARGGFLRAGFTTFAMM
jgi:hypothetical protein